MNTFSWGVHESLRPALAHAQPGEIPQIRQRSLHGRFRPGRLAGSVNRTSRLGSRCVRMQTRLDRPDGRLDELVGGAVWLTRCVAQTIVSPVVCTAQRFSTGPFVVADEMSELRPLARGSHVDPSVRRSMPSCGDRGHFPDAVIWCHNPPFKLMLLPLAWPGAESPT